MYKNASPFFITNPLSRCLLKMQELRGLGIFSKKLKYGRDSAPLQFTVNCFVLMRIGSIIYRQVYIINFHQLYEKH
ncbi:TPA: hypothetical protein DCX66_03965 [Candidatus Nomurabacteria bacterium]|nr:hypothetical protein [Candidatus Nomurabacteria bacterium]HAX65594.1 hypothetical protein [Candidatus Nomurabacteria bacterium]